MPIEKIDDFLTENHRRFSTLSTLVKRATNREVWTEELRALLPTAMRSSCEVVDLRGASLRVTCRNAAIATRLRFLTPDLIQALSQLGHFAELDEIRIHVAR